MRKKDLIDVIGFNGFKLILKLLIKVIIFFVQVVKI